MSAALLVHCEYVSEDNLHLRYKQNSFEQQQQPRQTPAEIEVLRNRSVSEGGKMMMDDNHNEVKGGYVTVKRGLT